MSEFSVKLVTITANDVEWTDCTAESDVFASYENIVTIALKSSNTQFIVVAVCSKRSA